MVDAWNRDVGFTYTPKKAKVAPIRLGHDDRRSAYLRNQAIQNANAVRERRATLENPDWLMSRPADWYTELDAQGEPSNWRAAKNVLQHRPAVTTDMNEQRNMFQMLANQAKGGDRGARLIDTRGLPAGARRTGRTMFQDPSKAQGFLGDVGSLFTGKNKAAVYADEYNPFPKAGFGADWYKNQFPISSGLGSFMEAAENFIPGATWAKQFLPKSKRLPLERDLSWVPEGVGEYDEIPEIPFMGEFEDVIGETPLEAVDRTDDWWYTPPFDDEVTITDLMEPEFEEETTETFTDLGDTHEFTEEFGWGAGDYVDVQEYVNSIIQDEDNPYYKMDQDELVKILIKQNRIKEKESESLEDINFQLDDILEDKADVLNDLEEIKRERKDIDEEAADLGLWYNI
jgi:hypothetical protein